MSGFDIDVLDVATGADEGATMQLTHPKTAEVLRDSDGNPVTMTLFGMNSERVRTLARAQQQRRLDAMKRGKRGMNPDELEADNVDILTAATGGWSFDTLGGQPFPYSEANARKLYSDPRFKSIRQQVDQFIADDGNFMKG